MPDKGIGIDFILVPDIHSDFMLVRGADMQGQDLIPRRLFASVYRY